MRWKELSPQTRRRLTIAVPGVIAALLLLTLAAPALPCQFPAGDVCPPGDDAEALVPADALAYVHMDLDPESEHFSAAAEVARDLPVLSDLLVERLLARLPGPRGRPADFEADIAPWFGGQAALALIPRRGAAEQVQLLQEDNTDAAAGFAERIATGKAKTTDYEGTEVTTDARGLASASVDGFLVIGTEAGVRSIIDAAGGAADGGVLADEDLADELRDELPEERFVTAYLSADGIRQLVADPASAFASIEPFVDSTSARAAAASLGAGAEGLELAVRSSLDPERAEESPGFFAAFPSFAPSLPEQLGADALAYMGIADPQATAADLLAQATAEAPALARALAAAAARLEEAAGADVRQRLLPALRGEAALALAPGEEGQSPGPGDSPVPVVQVIADEVDSKEAKAALARLQRPISEALDLGTTLQAPTFETRKVEGVDVRVLGLGPNLNLSYALDGDRLTIASQPEGVGAVIKGPEEGGLAESDSFEAATAELADEDELSTLLYLNLDGLIQLGEREGLAESPAYALYAEDLSRLDGLGLTVEADSSVIATNVRLVIGRAEEGPEDVGEPPTD